MSRGRGASSMVAACRVATLAACCVAALAAAWAAPARAAFGPIQLQSANSAEQAESAGEPAISADGRYLAFEGSIGGVEGVFRKDLQTGEVALVAGGSIYSSQQRALRSARAPSISADGRYVSFTDDAALVSAAHAGSNVYVRDMPVSPKHEGPCTQAQEGEGACPYEIASALNASGEGIAYAEGGAIASGRVSLSASGHEVAFVIEGASDLQSASPAALSTPGEQVVVRYLDRRETVLVSGERNPLSGQMTQTPVAGGAITPSDEQRIVEAGGPLPGAALSADGSTVAWLGAHIPAQAPTLEGERQQIENDDQGPEHYDEPLWRRIGDGPAAPTRRMVGGGDPLAPGCPAGGTISDPACDGPYPTLPFEDTRGGEGSYYGWLGVRGYDGVPQLSADGWTAALIGDPDSSSNVFLVNMHEGLDRRQALRQLTREVPVANDSNPGNNSRYVPQAGDVYEVAISPDGSRVAFTTQREQFPLAPPYFNEPPPNRVGATELYQIDLDNESLARVTHGPDDGPSVANGYIPNPEGAAEPSFSADDRTLAFADSASNLVFGDDNGASDVFTVPYEETPHLAGPMEIGAPPPAAEPAAPQWRMSVVPVVNADGSCTLQALVPAAGTLSATAAGVVPVQAARARGAHAVRAHTARGRSSGSRQAAARERSGRGSRKGWTGAGSSRGSRAKLASRTVASATTRAGAPGLVTLALRVAPAYQAALRSNAGIYATVTVTFHGDGGGALSQTLQVSLRDRRRNSPSSPRRKDRGGAPRRRGRRRP